MLGLGSSVTKPFSVQYTTPAPDGWQEFVDGFKNLFARHGRDRQALFANTNPTSASTRSAFVPFSSGVNVGAWVQDGQVVLNEHNIYVQMLVSAGEVDPDQTWSVQDFYDTAYANVDTSTEIGAAWFSETYLDSTYPVFSIDEMETFGVNRGMLSFVLGGTYTGGYSYYGDVYSFDYNSQLDAAILNPDFADQFYWMDNIPATVTPPANITVYPNTPLYKYSNSYFYNYEGLIYNIIANSSYFLMPEIAYQYGINPSIYNASLPGGTYYNNWGCNNPIINFLAAYLTIPSVGDPNTPSGGVGAILDSYVDGDTSWRTSSWWNSVVAWANENPHITGIYDPSVNTIVNFLEVFYSDDADNYGLIGFAPPV